MNDTWITGAVVLSVCIICFTWHFNVVEEQATIREQNQIQLKTIDAARDAAKSLEFWQKLYQQPQQQNQSLEKL